MCAFARMAAQQTTSTKSTVSGPAHVTQRREAWSILRLQRTIGNHAVQRLLGATTRPVLVAPATQEEKAGATQLAPLAALQSIVGGEEEMTELPEEAVQRKITATAVHGAPPAIQRVATWTNPVPHETNNLANTALDGADAGVTQLMTNGAIGAALNAPTVTVTPVAAGGFDATVTTVPANVGSVDETVLAPGPWRRVEPRANVGTRFPSLTQCTGAGDSNFRARGNPSDAAMAAANRRHEDRHATDGRAAFNGSVVPWDAALTAANAAGTTFHGATEAAARAALFTAMGGTVLQTRAALVAAWNAAIATYHGTAAGGPIGPPTDPTAAPNCSWSFARYRNPS